jgi:lactate permease
LRLHWGAQGAFFAGLATVSNLTFAGIQGAIARTLGFDRTSILACNP